MKWNILTRPLGQCDLSGGYAPRKAHIWPAVIMAGASLGSSIYNSIASSRANRRARRALQEEQARLDAEKRRRLNEDYLDTAAGQNLIRKYRQEADRLYQREAGAAAVTGATERAAMAKTYGNNQMAEAMADIAARDADRKDAIEDSYNGYERSLKQQQIALDQQHAQEQAQAVSQAVNSLGNAAAAYAGTYMGVPAGAPSGGTTGGLLKGMNAAKSFSDWAQSNTFTDYLKNYVKNMYKVGGNNFLTKESPLFTTDYKQFFGLKQ